MGEQTQPEKRFTRRQMMKGVPLGLAGAAAFSLISSRLISGLVRRKRIPDLPEDSIFAPDKSRYPQA